MRGGAHRRAPGGRVLTPRAWPGQAQKHNRKPPLCGPTSCGEVCQGRMLSMSGNRQGRVLGYGDIDQLQGRRTSHHWQVRSRSLCVSLSGINQTWLGSTLCTAWALESNSWREAGLSYSGVTQGERHRACVRILTSPGLNTLVVEFSTVNNVVASLHQFRFPGLSGVSGWCLGKSVIWRFLCSTG